MILLRVDANWRSEEALRYDMLGQPQKFVQALQHLVADHPDDPSYSVSLVEALVQVRNYKAARRMLDGGVRRHPDAVEVRFVWGLAHQQERDYAKAVEIYLEVVQRKPDYPEAWKRLAACQRQLDQEEQAVASYRQVLRYEAFDVDAHIGSGRSAVETGPAGRRGQAPQDGARTGPRPSGAWPSRRRCARKIRLPAGSRHCIMPPVERVCPFWLEDYGSHCPTLLAPSWILCSEPSLIAPRIEGRILRHVCG